MMAVVTDNDKGTDNEKWEWEGGKGLQPHTEGTYIC